MFKWLKKLQNERAFDQRLHTENLSSWLFRKLFKKEKKVVVLHSDPAYREAVARAFTSGKPVIGNKNDDGTWDIREIDV